MKLVLLLSIVMITQVYKITSTSFHCENQLTCQECIQSPLCGWCLEKNFSSKRCLYLKTLLTGNYTCRNEHIYFPLTKVNILKDEENSIRLENSIAPQEVELSLAKGVPYEMSLIYTVGADFNGSSIALNHNSGDEIVISYTSKCAGEKTLLTNTCKNVKPGQQIEFKVQFVLQKCPKKAHDMKQTLDITSADSRNFMRVHIELLCSCPCDEPPSTYYKENATECNGNTLSCGTCKCKAENFGRFCECSFTNSEDLEIDCPTGEPGFECSGRGQCVCNKCICEQRPNPNEIIFGKHCECDNFTCPLHEGIMCNGKGRCDCGVCVCEPLWSGKVCATKSV